MNHSNSRLTWAWKLALISFVIAGSTGVLLRYAMLYGAPWGLHLQDMRHAHSHLMYFGWATPALMTLIVRSLPRYMGRATLPGAGRIIGATIVVALLAYVSFLRFGYRPASIGTRQLPLSTIAAGLNVFAWYGFAFVYRRETRNTPRFLPLRLWDAALVFMALSSLGAWGLAIATAAGIDSQLVSSALTHLFLDLFADGWFLLALLGLAFVAIPANSEGRRARLGENLIVIGLPLTFLLNVPQSLLPDAVRVLAGLCAIIAGAGLLILLAVLFQALTKVENGAMKRLWGTALFFLALKALAFFVVSIPDGAAWSLRMGLRISYLHWLLLGGVSMGVVAAVHHYWSEHEGGGWRLLHLTIIILILSLVPLSGLWPASWKGRWIFELAAWAAFGPVLAAIYMLVKGSKWNRVRREEPPGSVRPEFETGTTL